MPRKPRLSSVEAAALETIAGGRHQRQPPSHRYVDALSLSPDGRSCVSDGRNAFNVPQRVHEDVDLCAAHRVPPGRRVPLRRPQRID